MIISYYRIGCNLMKELFPLAVSPLAPGALYDRFTEDFKARYMRHRPFSADRRPSCLFEVELPRQLGKAYRLAEHVSHVSYATTNATARRSAKILRERLAADLGLPPFVVMGSPNLLPVQEAVFLVNLKHEPGDELTWLAYADWLEESGEVKRARIIRVNVRGSKVAA